MSGFCFFDYFCRVQIVTRYITLLQLLLLLTPSAIQLAHTFEEDHDHVVVCSAVDEQHFHENNVECSILLFHLETFDYQVPKLLGIQTLPETDKQIEGFSQSLLTHTVQLRSSRAPPVLSL
ncbi:hypothetical protein TPENAI_60528 [Tenacibaculum litopenaei]